MFSNIVLLVFFTFILVIVLSFFYHIIRFFTGANDVEQLTERINWLEEKLSQYSPHVNWAETGPYNKSEEKYWEIEHDE